MCNKTWLVTEGFTILFAPIGLLSSMNSLMYKEVTLLNEAFPTFTAWFLSCVSFLMYKELRLPREGFPTLTACVGFYSSFNLHMYTKLCLPAEGFTTFKAFIRLLSCMCSLVYSELRLFDEGFTTFHTLMFLSFFNLMYTEFWSGVESVSTFIAFNSSVMFFMFTMKKWFLIFIKLVRILCSGASILVN